MNNISSIVSINNKLLPSNIIFAHYACSCLDGKKGHCSSQIPHDHDNFQICKNCKNMMNGICIKGDKSICLACCVLTSLSLFMCYSCGCIMKENMVREKIYNDYRKIFVWCSFCVENNMDEISKVKKKNEVKKKK